MNFADLRQQIVAALGSELGTYTFQTPDGPATTPAIRVEEEFEAEPEVAGLEVVIRPYTDVQVVSFLDGDRRLANGYEVVLKQWSRNARTTTAREILIGVLEVEGVSIVPSLGGLDNIEITTLTLSDDVHFFG